MDHECHTVNLFILADNWLVDRLTTMPTVRPGVDFNLEAPD